jgi:Glucodextranase, domain B
MRPAAWEDREQMPSRRGSSHVRPRPPSSGRPRIQPLRPKAPDRRRVRQVKGMKARRRRAPLVTRTVLALAVAVLAAAAFLAASGGVGPVFSTLAAGFSTAVGKLTATPIPSHTFLPPTDSPRIAGPVQPYTNKETVELTVSVPIEVLGDPTARVRIYLALEGLEPAPVVDVPVGTTSRMVVPFDLTEGRNDISATLFRAEEESDHSPIVTYILDLTPPKITVTSPRSGAAIATPEVRVRGTTQGGTALVAHNEANGTSISTAAGRDGSFEFALQLAPGKNKIEITGTDPAGNVGTSTLSVLQGSKEIGVRLTASTYRIDISRPPSSLQLAVLVTDPAGSPLPGATAFFTLQIPGLAPISNQLVTGPNGRATFTTPLVGELTKGGGIGTVQVTTELYGTSSDTVTLTFVK